MQKVVLPNGLTVIFEPQKGKSVVVEVMVKVGSNHEKTNERGISHFIEHMLFEGTVKRPSNQEISNEIEKLGGEFNAYTTCERTCFYVKVLKKHFRIAVEILADILQNSSFGETEIKKEKRVVLKEIDLVNDEPKFYQWIMLQKNLFQKNPCRNPTYGDKEVIRGLTRSKILDYFHRYYTPKNMIISVVGDITGWKKEIQTQFSSLSGKLELPTRTVEPISTRNRIIKQKRDVANTYVVLGFKTVPKHHSDSYPLEIIDGILGRGQSGKMFTEIRGKKGLAYDVGTQNISEISYGYFAVYATIDRKNIELVKTMMIKELERLQDITVKELEEAKTYVEGDFYLEIEDNQKVADQLLFFAQAGKAEELHHFVPKAKKVSLQDVKRVAKKYFKNYVFAVIEGR
ncbi:MAG: pitrilysin family protein [Candidatus Woesearchaeota archaeon]|jgi:predicted Zn-dependent peptidase